jgi:hypothetical protein
MTAARIALSVRVGGLLVAAHVWTRTMIRGTS